MVYEAMLLFGIAFVADFLFDVLTQSRHALSLRAGRQAWLFVVFGVYFVYCWTRSGQTLAMQTWRIKVADDNGGRIPVIKAIVRYCLAWMWFLPAMALVYQFNLKQWPMVIAVSAGAAAWGAMVLLRPDRQFLHDHLAKTRLLHIPAVKQDSTADQ